MGSKTSPIKNYCSSRKERDPVPHNQLERTFTNDIPYQRARWLTPAIQLQGGRDWED
jgi:hypothetical protein